MTRTAAIETARAGAEPTSERRWSVWRAILAAPFLPATTARRTTHLSLATAYAVHVVGVLLTVAIIFVIVAVGQQRDPLTLQGVLDQMAVGLTRFGDELAESTQWVALGLALSATAIEAFVVLLPITVVSWGARDEPLLESFEHTLRTVLLRTTHAALIGVCIAASAAVVGQGGRHWQRVHNMPEPVMPSLALTPPGSQPPGATYSRRFQVYVEEHREWNAKRKALQPWYLAYPAIVNMNTIWVCVAWFVWALLRGVGARSEKRAAPRNPMCDTCGYNLLTISMDSRCPECGEAVHASLGPDVRPGAAWERRGQLGRWASWWTDAKDAALRPEVLGRRIRLLSPGRAHRSFLAVHLPVIFLAGGATTFFAALVDAQAGPLPGAPEIPFGLVPLIGCVACVVTIGLMLLSASVIGFVYSVKDHRNLLPGAVQVSCYLSAFMTVWVLFAGANAMATFFLEKEEWSEALETLSGVNRDLVTVLSWLVPNCIIGLWYLTRVAKGTAATRYANR